MLSFVSVSVSHDFDLFNPQQQMDACVRLFSLLNSYQAELLQPSYVVLSADYSMTQFVFDCSS